MLNDKPDRILGDVRAVMERFRITRDGTRMMWLRARRAINDAQRVRDMVKAQIDGMAGDQEFRFKFQTAMLRKILDSAINQTSADMGNIQVFDPESRHLKILVHRGFDASFLDFFSKVDAGHASCGTAMQTRTRVIVEDTTNSDVFRGSPALEVLLDANVRAVQSTPLIGSTSQFLGVLSTHYRIPGRPRRGELELLDFYSKQAASLIEWSHGGLPTAGLALHLPATARPRPRQSPISALPPLRTSPQRNDQLAPLPEVPETTAALGARPRLL